jgi:hypothetical protein
VNKYTIIVLAAGVGFILALLALIIILDKDIDAYVGALSTLFYLVVGSGVVTNVLTKAAGNAKHAAVKADESAETVQLIGKNVNGNTTRMLDELLRQREELAAYRAGRIPVNSDAQGVLVEPISEDTILRIQNDAAALPSH